MIGFSETDPSPTERFRRLEELAPSAKLVYRVLDEEAPLTQAQLRERTLLPGRTLRHAIGNLREADVVVTRVVPEDPRRHVYSLRPVERPDERPDERPE